MVLCPSFYIAATPPSWVALCGLTLLQLLLPGVQTLRVTSSVGGVQREQI